MSSSSSSEPSVSNAPPPRHIPVWEHAIPASPGPPVQRLRAKIQGALLFSPNDWHDAANVAWKICDGLPELRSCFLVQTRALEDMLTWCLRDATETSIVWRELSNNISLRTPPPQTFVEHRDRMSDRIEWRLGRLRRRWGASLGVRWRQWDWRESVREAAIEYCNSSLDLDELTQRCMPAEDGDFDDVQLLLLDDIDAISAAYPPTFEDLRCDALLNNILREFLPTARDAGL